MRTPPTLGSSWIAFVSATPKWVYTRPVVRNLRKRHPLDVPTPVAVALADFCRRAGAVTDPRSVRDALSLIDATLDARVLELAAAPPQMKPLGPFAVIDMLDGMTPQDASRRQR